MPTVLVREKLPPAYEPSLAGGNLAQMFLDFTDCRTVSVGGVDQGPAALTFVRVPIESPAGNTPDGAFRDYFITEIATSNKVLGEWVSAWAIPTSRAALASEITSIPGQPYFKQLDGAVLLNDSPAYEFRGLVQFPEDNPEQVTDRCYFGPTPATDFLQFHSNVLISGASEGTLTAAASTAFATWTGLTAHNTLQTSMTAEHLTIEPSVGRATSAP